MAINGTGAPKFVYNYGETGAVTVALDYARDTKAEYIHDYIEHESELDGEREAYLKSVHVRFTVILNLYKYTNPNSKLATLNTYKGLKVSLWEHTDGNPFYKNTSGGTALFLLKEVHPFYLEDVTYKDAVKLVFESMNKVVINPSVVP